jgi:hypothetical protein
VLRDLMEAFLGAVPEALDGYLPCNLDMCPQGLTKHMQTSMQRLRQARHTLTKNACTFVSFCAAATLFD